MQGTPLLEIGDPTDLEVVVEMLSRDGAAIARRQRNREIHARLAARYDAVITLAAPGAAPVGLGSTGNPVFNVPASMLGVPAVSLPLLLADGLPLGLQIVGFAGEDARLFAIAAAIHDLLAAAR